MCIQKNEICVSSTSLGLRCLDARVCPRLDNFRNSKPALSPASLQERTATRLPHITMQKFRGPADKSNAEGRFARSDRF